MFQISKFYLVLSPCAVSRAREEKSLGHLLGPEISYGSDLKDRVAQNNDCYDFSQTAWLALLGSMAKHVRASPQAKMPSHPGIFVLVAFISSENRNKKYKSQTLSIKTN